MGNRGENGRSALDRDGAGFARRDVLRLMAGLGAVMTGIPALGAGPGVLIERPIPSSGEKLPVIGLGTWQTFDIDGDPAGRAQAREVLKLFVEGGGRVVDSSPMYGTAESVVGNLSAELGIQSKLFYATKVWTSGRDDGIRQMEASMTRLRVARIDLMQVHNLVDVRTHLATLREWKKAGKLRYIGITHYHAGAHAELENLVRSEELDFIQVNYSLTEPQAGNRLLPLAAERRVAVLVNRPFAQGDLFERVRGNPVPPWAAEFGCTTWAQFFLKWIVGHPAVTCVIPATRNPKHLADNLAAGSGALPDAAMRSRMAAQFG
jgi:diketogulonate reductase-like aldo/keto reductase